MADIFLSYEKDDRPIAERLVDALRREGKSVWWDDALTPAEAWDAMIEKEIAGSRTVLVLWSPRSVLSDWVRSEAHYAQDHHKLVPVIVEPCSIPLAFRLRQAVDLSNGKFDRSNPNWERLLAWIDAVNSGGDDSIHAGPEGASPSVAAAAAIPAKAASGDSWLGPAKSKRTALIAGAVVAAIALALFLGRGMLFGAGAHPNVYVDSITVSKDPSLPANFAQSVNDELGAQLNAASRITPLDSEGKRHTDGYQMSGSVGTDNGKIVLFAKIFAPGIEAPILSPKIEVPPDLNAAAAKFLGTRAANLFRCIATASDSNGSEILVLPEAAIRPWAQYCGAGFTGSADPSTMLAQLEEVVKAAPNFSNGWAAIADTKASDIQGPADMEVYRNAYQKALQADPKNPKAMMLKAMDIVGGWPNVPLRNFAAFDKLAVEANEARPSDCGCEAQIYRDVLLLTGRYDEALTIINRIIANNPSAGSALAQKSLVLAALGRTSDAQSVIDGLNRDWPGARSVTLAAFVEAVDSRNWDAAKALVPKLPPFPGSDKAGALIDALKTGNKAAADMAVAPMIAGLSQVEAVNPAMATLVAASGHSHEIAVAMPGWAKKYGALAFDFAWMPSQKEVRAQPEFLALVRQYNLPGYWKLPGHKPYVCGNGSDEPVCKLI